MYYKLLRKLRSEYPEVAKRAEELNKRDGFVMYKRVDKDSSDKDNDKKRKRDKKISSLKDSGFFFFSSFRFCFVIVYGSFIPYYH
jgi:hypothetical protein